MTTALLIQTRKEVRALLPWTIGVAVGSMALAVAANGNVTSINYRELQVFFFMAYALGALAISALSVGQELTHGTLAGLLVQPVDRFKVLALKLSVLAVALIGLGLMASATLPQTYLPDSPDLRRLLIWGPVAAGIGLAPLLTLLSRRPLGGIVFSPTTSGAILAVSERLYPFHKGDEAWTITWYGTLLVSAAGLAALVARFRTLEVAGEGAGRTAAAVSSPAETVAYIPTPKRSWLWLVVKKEFRLQQMTFAVSGLYVLGAVAAMIVAAINPPYIYPTFGAISIIHAYCIPVIAGSVASAEERHMGTLAGQILQPREMRLQWILKVVVTIGVTLLLAFGLPVLLMAIRPQVDTSFRVETDFMIGIGILGAAAMWVSSISNNPLLALLGTAPVIGLAGLVGGAGFQFLNRLVGSWIGHPFDWHRDHLLREAAFQEGMSRAWLRPFWQASIEMEHSLYVIQVSLLVSFGLLLLFFAARNHRTLDRNIRRVSGQLLMLSIFATAAATGYLALQWQGYNWMNW